jgi:hypothetical protein
MPHLLPTVKNEGFGSQAVEELPTSIPSQTKAEGGIVERLHARIGGINLSPTMLEENVDGDIESEGLLRSIEGDALGDTYGEGLLMGISTEDETLPIDPGIEVIAGTVDEDLEAHLRVLRKIDLCVHQRLNNAVIGTTVDIAKDEGDAAQLCLCPQEWQNMRTTLILVALPSSNVVIGKARVFVGAIIDGSMEASLKTHIVERLVGEARLQPEARKSVSRSLLTVELIVLEECKRVGINGEDTRIIGRKLVV